MNPFLIAISLLLITFVYLYLSGMYRYIYMYLDNPEKYLKNYQNLDKADTNNKVIVSITTTPNKISKLKPVLNSILDQTVKIDQIALNIPYKYNGNEYKIPEEFTKFVSVYRCGMDYGPGTKLIPTLLREDECGTIIITLDDDQIYGKDFIETLIYESNKNPNNAIYINENKCSSGLLVKPEFFDPNNILKRDINLLEDDWIKNNIKAKCSKINYNGNIKLF
jgi:hypothetical protein